MQWFLIQNAEPTDLEKFLSSLYVKASYRKTKAHHDPNLQSLLRLPLKVPQNK